MLQTGIILCTTICLPLRPDAAPSGGDCCLVSATEATGLCLLLGMVEEAVLEATGQRLHEVVVPADGPQLRYGTTCVHM